MNVQATRYGAAHLIIKADAVTHCGAHGRPASLSSANKTGDFTGFAMKRGTIVLNRPPKPLFSTIHRGGPFGLGVSPFGRIRPVPHALALHAGNDVNRHGGDLSTRLRDSIEL